MKRIVADEDLHAGSELGGARVRSQAMGVNWARLSAGSHYKAADVVKEMWDVCRRRQPVRLKGEMNQRSAESSLSWQEVFEDPCAMEQNAGRRV